MERRRSETAEGVGHERICSKRDTQLYDIYRPIARKYGLRMSSHTSIYDDGWIKIYKGEGTDRQQIIKIEEANDTDLYDRAREAVISWENSKKERNARR
jgi:hypothetical protein